MNIQPSPRRPSPHATPTRTRTGAGAASPPPETRHTGTLRRLALLRGLERTLFVASHDLEFVLALCTRVLVLDGGHLVADGEPRAVLGDEALMLAHGLERPHSLTPHPHAHEGGERPPSGRSPLVGDGGGHEPGPGG